MSFDKKIRIYVGAEDHVRSLRFSVDRHKRDVYVTCSKMPNRKLSLHKSGKTRDAIVSSVPRPAIESAYLLKMQPGQFWTVARFYFTTHDDWRRSRGPLRGKSVILPPPPNGHCSTVALGFTNHHPAEHAATNHPANKATMMLRQDKFLTATREELSMSTVEQQIFAHLSPHRETSFTEHEFAIEGDDDHFDYLLQYRSKLNTFVYWAHHGIPRGDVGWKGDHPLLQAIASSHARELAGISLGHTVASVQRAVGPEPDRDPGD